MSPPTRAGHRLDHLDADTFLRRINFPDSARHLTFEVFSRSFFAAPAQLCPEPRTVVMRIVGGEGAGSVVETHATPLGRGHDGRDRSAVVEAVIAGSDRRGFAVARGAVAVLRPIMKRAAARLWRDDLAYAERRYALRTSPSPRC